MSKHWRIRAAQLAGSLVAVLVAICWSIRQRRGPQTDTSAEKPPAMSPEAVRMQPQGRSGVLRKRFTFEPQPKNGRPHDQGWQDGVRSMQVADDVLAVVGLGTNRMDVASRRAAMRKLTRTLPEGDAQALRLFLRSTLDGQANPIDGDDFFALKNDVLDILVRQEAYPRGLAVDLAEMALDKSQDTVWRDYCVQYLADCHARLTSGQEQTGNPSTVPTPQTEREAILTAFETALQERDSTLAGTALIGLEQVSRSDDMVDRTVLSGIASDIALDDAASEASRITSLRVAALMGSGSVIQAARMLSQVGETETLRLAAVATLGDVGTAEDLELMQALSVTAETRMRPVLAGALKRLKERLARTGREDE